MVELKGIRLLIDLIVRIPYYFEVDRLMPVILRNGKVGRRVREKLFKNHHQSSG